jgi:glycine/serine hydroxymethyltransferase
MNPNGAGGPVHSGALKAADPDVYELCRAEERRQAEKIRLIPSENYDETAERVLGEVRELTRKFPAPGIG